MYAGSIHRVPSGVVNARFNSHGNMTLLKKKVRLPFGAAPPNYICYMIRYIVRDDSAVSRDRLSINGRCMDPEGSYFSLFIR